LNICQVLICPFEYINRVHGIPHPYQDGITAIPAYSPKAEKQGILEFMFRKLLT